MKNLIYLILTILALILLPIFSFSQVYVKSTAPPLGDGNSWATAYTDVQVGIEDAKIAGEEVWVAAGTYQHGSQMVLRNGVTVYGGFPNVGNPVWGDRNYTVNITILSGNNAYRVIRNSGGSVDATAILDGCTIQDGNVAGQGAGIYIDDCSPTYRNCIIQNNNATGTGGDGAGVYLRDVCTSVFSNCIIQNNIAGDNGGGIQTVNATCIPTFTNCTIDNNHSGDHGAGVRIYRSSPTFNNCDITNNIIDVVSCGGGGIQVENTANPTITNCNITGNTATRYGGGIYSTSTTWTNAISGNTISNNMALGSSAYGGGIYLDNSGPNITNNTISNNIARGTDNTNGRGRGGAIYLYGNDLTPTISGNIITGNTAESIGDGNSCGYGGAIYANQSIPVINSNTISNNTATTSGIGTSCGRGGALYIDRGAVNITNNVINNNTANTTNIGTGCGYGGGIYLYRTLTNSITNNQITNNAQIYGGGIYMYQSDPILTSNTIDGNIVTAYRINTAYGGGICIYDDTGSGTSPTLTSNIIRNNQANDNGFATSGYGAGVYFRSNVDPIMTTNTINNNTASQRGGGIYFRDNATNPIFNRNNIYSNSATDGGGIYIDGNKTPEFYNNLIYSNNATNGGGFYFNGTDNGIYLNNTVADNTATNGGGVACTNNADLHLTNTIFWGNSGAGSNIFLNDGNSDPYFENCCVEGGIAAFTGGGSGGYNAGHYTNNIEIDPIFSDAIYHITEGTSPCISGGDAGTVTGDFPSDEDYDANKRVRGTVDIGAYETNNPPQFITLPYPPITDNPGPENVTMSEDELDAGGAPDPFVLSLSAIDLDDENLTWSILTPASNGAASVPPNSTIPNAQTLAITYTPNPHFYGTDAFIVQVSDGMKTDQITVNVTVTSVNDPPFFNPVPTNQFVKANKTLNYNITTTDYDMPADVLTLSCLLKPAGMVFSLGANGCGSITWTPNDADVLTSPHEVRMRIQDADGEFEDVSFFVTVGDRYIYVPTDYTTIQEAINNAENGVDKIIVLPGTYSENINLNGKTIEIEGDPSNPANVIIDGGSSGPCITIEDGGAPTIDGFTLTNGSGRLGMPSTFTLHAPSSAMYGGGIFCYQSDPILQNLIISGNTLNVNNNHGGCGAAIYIANNSTVIIRGTMTVFTITNNNAITYRGGGICIDDSDVTINATNITNNQAGNYGGGIAVYNSVLNISNINITGNSVGGLNGSGGGIFSINSTINNGAGVNVSGNSASKGNNDIHTNP